VLARLTADDHHRQTRVEAAGGAVGVANLAQDIEARGIRQQEVEDQQVAFRLFVRPDPHWLGETAVARTREPSHCSFHAEAAAQRIRCPVGSWHGQRLSPPRRARLVPPRDSVRNMSQQNVAVARRWVELFNGRDDVDEFLSLHDPEVELQTPGGPRLRGHDQVRDWFEAPFENVQPRILPERFVAGGDTVVGLGRIEVRWIESGEVAHEGESAGTFWFRDGKIIAWQPFETHAAALEGTGLGE
jgi:ketosteroid isomerase-like protein